MPEPGTRTETAVYDTADGKVEIAYDPDAPCWMCGLPVGAASMGGAVICPSCDCGYHRDGRQWTLEDTQRAYENLRRNRAEAEARREAELERQASVRVEPGVRSTRSPLAERSRLA